MACVRCSGLREMQLVEAYHNDKWVICSILSCAKHNHHTGKKGECDFSMFLNIVNTETMIMDQISCNQYNTKWRFISNSKIAQPASSEPNIVENNHHKLAITHPTNLEVNGCNKVSMQSHSTQTQQNDNDHNLINIERSEMKRKRPSQIKQGNNNRHLECTDFQINQNKMKKNKKRRFREFAYEPQLDHYIECAIDHALSQSTRARNDKQASFGKQKTKWKKSVAMKEETESMSMEIDEQSNDGIPTDNEDAVICPVCSRSFQAQSHFLSHIKQKRDTSHRQYCQQHL